MVALLLSVLSVAAAAELRDLLPPDVAVSEHVALTTPPKPSDAMADAAVGVRLFRERAGESGFAAAPGDTVFCPGDRVAFELEFSRDGYVVVLNGTNGDDWHRVSPVDVSVPLSGGGPVVRNLDPKPVSGGRTVRVPQDPRDGSLVTAPLGMEHVILLFSPSLFSAELVAFEARFTGVGLPDASADGDGGGGSRGIGVDYRALQHVTEPSWVPTTQASMPAFTLRSAEPGGCSP